MGRSTEVISHYADDILVAVEASLQNGSVIRDIFTKYCALSGLRIVPSQLWLLVSEHLIPSKKTCISYSIWSLLTNELGSYLGPRCRDAQDEALRSGRGRKLNG